MADLGTYVTPDGRQVQLPPDFASQFVGLSPADVGGGPPAGPPLTLPDTGAVLPPAPPALAGPDPQPVPPTDGPVTSPDQLSPSTGQPARPRGPVVTPAEDTGVSSLAKPQPVPGAPGAAPLTNDQLAKLGNAGAYNVQQQGLSEERAATRRQGEALANQATAIGNAMATANDEADRLLAQRQKVAEDNARALQAKQDEYIRNATVIANTKIDRTVDQPVLTAIGLALSALGSAMKGQDSSTAIKGVYDAIDRKVAAQMQDLDLKRQGLGVQKEAIGFQQQAGRDRLEQLDTYRIAAIEQAKRKIDQIRQQTSVDTVRSGADLAIAQLTQKQGEILGTAVGREQQKREAEAARAQAAQFHGDTMRLGWAQLEEQRQARAAALAEKLIDAKGAAGAAQAKLISEQGIVDPSTGDFMLTPEGQKKMAQADAYEAQARQATDPAQAQKLNAMAQQYRESAKTNDIAVALNKKGAEEAQKTAKVAQDMANNVDAARRMLQAGPGAWDRKQWAQIVVALQGVKVNYAQQMGERMSPKALDAIDDVLSIDPDSIWSRTADQGKALAALDTVETQINQSADVALKSAGVKSGWTPAKAKSAPTFSGKTATEAAEGKLPASGVPQDNGVPYDPTKTWIQNNAANPGRQAQLDAANNTDAQAAADAASARTNTLANGKPGQSNAYGLDPKDHTQALAEIRRAGTAGNAEHGRIVENLAAPLTDDKRPSLVRGLAKLVNDEDPKLFDEVVAKVASSPGGGELAAKRLREITAPPPGARQAPSVRRGSVRPATPADLAKYNEYLRSIGLPEVAQ